MIIQGNNSEVFWNIWIGTDSSGGYITILTENIIISLVNNDGYDVGLFKAIMLQYIGSFYQGREEERLQDYLNGIYNYFTG